MVLDSICGVAGGPLWDWNITWNTETPTLTGCFKDTVPYWVPCGMFFVLLPLEYIQLKNLSLRSCPWRPRDYARIMFLCLLFFAVLARLVGKSVLWFTDNPAWFAVGEISYCTLLIAIFVIIYTTYRRQKRVYTGSGVTWLTVFALCVSGSLQCATTVQLIIQKSLPGLTVSEMFDSISYLIYYTLVIVNLFCLSFSSVRSDYTMLQNEGEQPAWPEEFCSYPNQLFYWWFKSIVLQGYKRNLEIKDVWFAHRNEQTAHICSYFSKAVDKEYASVVAAKKFTNANSHEIDSVEFVSKKKPSLLKVLVKCFGLRIVGAATMMAGFLLLNFAEPIFVGFITRYAQNVATEPSWHGYVYVVLLALIFLIRVFIDQQSFFIMIRQGTKIRNGLMSVIYRKALRISPEARKTSTVGEIVNLMSVDADRFKGTTQNLHDLLPAPIQLGLGYFYLYQLVGPSAFAGLAVAVVIFVMNFFSAQLYEKWETLEMDLKDDRLKIMSEIINGIKVLKLYAWEPAFQKKVENIRQEELSFRRKSSYLGGFFEVAWHCTVLLSSLATFVTYVLVNPDKTLTPEIIFVSLTIFHMLNFSVQVLPAAVVMFITTKVSYNRIHDFLSSQELNAPDDNASSHFGSPDIEMKDASFAWETSATEPVLKNVNMQILNGKLVAVVGKIGCGKSSLLSALCGEMFCINGSYNVKGSIAFVSQQAWIQNMSLKDNILFNKDFDPVLYNKVLDSCALRPDLEILSGGDSTEIGERGINLSGGQKMRVSLARATYQDTEVYLLDDPLAAVDVHVGKQIFQEVIGPTGMLAKKVFTDYTLFTRIMVTHGLTYLPQCDFIIVMKDGTIDRIGTFQELKNEEGAFSEILQQYFQQASEEELEEIAVDSELKELTKEEAVLEALHNRQLSRQTSVPQKSISSSDAILQRLLSVTSNEGSLKDYKPNKNMNEINSRLVEDENLETGSVSWTVYWTYALAAGFGLFGYAFCVFGSEVFQLLSTFWLQIWSDNSHAVSMNATSDIISIDVGLRNYGLLGLGQVLFTSMLGICFATFQIRAAKKMHSGLVKSLLKAPMSFFDTTPTGRIVNRCGRDIDTIDESIPGVLDQFWHFVFETLRSVAAVLIAAPYFALALIPCIICYFFAQRFYVRTSRQLRRLDAVNRSPIYSHFQESLQGVSTIRAFRLQQTFVTQSERLIDVYCSADLCRTLSNRWIAIYLDLSGNALAVIVALIVVIMVQRGMSAGLAGLTLSYAMDFTGNLMWGVWVSGVLETEMVAVERVKEYTEIPSEAPWENSLFEPPDSWPDKGCINFVDYCTQYRSGLPLVLDSLTFPISAGQKIGVIGRTGAGKSSMTLALFRLVESTNGKIVVDGVDIGQLGLHDLRRNLTIIPQDPVIFSGPLRSNIDPFENFSDADIWQVLELSHLKHFVASLPDQLKHEVSEGGGNLSVGQRQLICLARALLRKSKILVLDEATASVDVETDAFIQQTIREQYKDCTLITIAHRLNTITDSDKILVLDNGRLAEFDSPERLLQQPNSLFNKMMQESSNLH